MGRRSTAWPARWRAMPHPSSRRCGFRWSKEQPQLRSRGPRKRWESLQRASCHQTSCFFLVDGGGLATLRGCVLVSGGEMAVELYSYLAALGIFFQLFCLFLSDCSTTCLTSSNITHHHHHHHCTHVVSYSPCHYSSCSYEMKVPYRAVLDTAQQ